MSILNGDQTLVLLAMLGGLLGFLAQRTFHLGARVAVAEARLAAWESGLSSITDKLDRLCREFHDLRVTVAGKGARGFIGPQGGEA